MTLHKKHYLRLILIVIATLFYFLANFQRVAIPGAIFSLLQTDLGTCASKITLLGAIFCYIYAFTQLIVGLMVDKIGGFRVIALGCVLFTIGALIFPCCNSLALLYLSRALVGFGAATFYLSTIREVKKFAKDKNFSLAISYILFIGYSGGIVANAPFVHSVSMVGWKNALLIIALFSFFLMALYLILLAIFKPIRSEKEASLSILPFREILTNKKNIILYIFGASNYGLYYVLQSVIGKKFLEDFCNFSISQGALILSVMAIVASFAGTITAYISKLIGNKRAIIFKIYALFSLFSTLIVFLCLTFELHTKIIALIFLIPSFIGSISPLLILSLHTLNRYEISATAVSVQNFCFFSVVGILGTLTGVLMNLYEPKNVGGTLVYSHQSYFMVFLLFLIISIVEVIFAFKIKDEA